jgi:hypothetical protein
VTGKPGGFYLKDIQSGIQATKNSSQSATDMVKGVFNGDKIFPKGNIGCGDAALTNGPLATDMMKPNQILLTA